MDAKKLMSFDDSVETIQSFIGDSEKVEREWRADIVGAYGFEEMVGGPVMPVRYKILCDEGDTVLAHTFYLSLPREFHGVSSDRIALMGAHAIVTAFAACDPWCVIIYTDVDYQMLSTPELNLQKYRDSTKEPYCNLLSAEAFFVSKSGYHAVDSLFTMEFSDKNDVSTFLRTGEVYQCESHLAADSDAEKLFGPSLEEALTAAGASSGTLTEIRAFNKLIAEQVRLSLAQTLPKQLHS
jgi:hypothetical protein